VQGSETDGATSSRTIVRAMSFQDV
jgi:hypothetical protein